MLRFALCFTLALGTCAHESHADFIAPDIVLAEDTSEADAAEHAFAEATTLTRQNIKLMGADKCVSNSEKAIKDVLDEVKSAQTTLNGLDNGKNCKKEQQSEIDNAKAKVSNAKAKVTRTTQALSSAKNAHVTVKGTWSHFKNQCNNFYRKGSWKTADKLVTDTTTELKVAKSELSSAESNLRSVKETARKARLACKCRVRKEVKVALKNAEKATAQRKKSIIRELLLICLVKARTGNRTHKQRNGAAANCKGKGMPSSYSASSRAACAPNEAPCTVNLSLGLSQTTLATDVQHTECKKLLTTDSCKGFRIDTTGCSKGNVAFQVYKDTNWDKNWPYTCPEGWYWPKGNTFFNYEKGNGCYGNNNKAASVGGYAYMTKCGWSSYVWEGKTRYYFRFKDSKKTNAYQHAGNYMGYKSVSSSTSQFGGIICMKNGVTRL